MEVVQAPWAEDFANLARTAIIHSKLTRLVVNLSSSTSPRELRQTLPLNLRTLSPLTDADADRQLSLLLTVSFFFL